MIPLLVNQDLTPMLTQIQLSLNRAQRSLIVNYLFVVAGNDNLKEKILLRSDYF